MSGKRGRSCDKRQELGGSEVVQVIGWLFQLDGRLVRCCENESWEATENLWFNEKLYNVRSVSLSVRRELYGRIIRANFIYVAITSAQARCCGKDVSRKFVRVDQRR